MNKCVVFVANRGYALTSSRTEIIQFFLSIGWKVIIATSNDKESHYLEKLGAVHEQVKFNRGGFSLFADIVSFLTLYKVYKKWSPSIIHHFHAKPVIFGSIAARIALGNKVNVVSTITGLGHAFIQGGILSKFVGLGYRLSLQFNRLTIFQNTDDQSLFIDNKWIEVKKTKLILGSGVDIDEFYFVDRSGRNNSALIVIMFGRLLNQKGLNEFIEVAENIRNKYPKIRFLWAGEEDSEHPDSVDKSKIYNNQNIEYIGRLQNVINAMASADILLFPSYREGIPRGVLEASSTGLPVVAFDVAGVKDSINDNLTGYLVKFRNVKELTRKVEYLINNEDIRLEMGKFGRENMKKNFEKKSIQNTYINCYKNLGIKF